MFTVELKINGTMIGHIYGHNEGLEDEGLTKYSWEYYRIESRKVTSGTVLHHRDDGLESLVAKILEEQGGG